MEDIERTLQQENVGRDNMAGSGEWPDPDTPPSDVAPGTDPIRKEMIERERGHKASDQSMKDVLNRDRVESGSSSIPAEMVPDEEGGRKRGH